ncbi:MAG TPA: [protein-PII] uridylyltransferase [Pseudomonadales bacterium]|jgi:[protein-PII] uridylyltransferase|nr:[protein-PII] uridylyltransferase [Gammaproteobacteria bacterium]MDP6026056.1 [protein-PII] uridylyltransferase [Pseudomonadales bacterium]MDP6316966.1 [protein-PII] uridylyltransferase [Pseudomonadales bacterium]MDP7314227.1 [protein-PII] uridylyltransferase [Pseudomonadales bacterium]HJL61787.1 [protein-PII] uridylyltransferase [Pseudomonadales bacterium]|tara:strand:+ start:803 stop:3490 length:2688 start_codon:yes stop_codon:yes gene_type:complete
MLDSSSPAPSLASQLDDAKQAIPVFKAALVERIQILEKRFYAGDDVTELITDHANFVNEILQLAWRRFSWDENITRWRKTRISLVAVGGFGRGRLHPHSDIDLLILLERNSYQKHAANIQSFLALLWDIGLEVGHSVRSIKECRIQAQLDVTVVTALMEGRTICGDPELFERVFDLTGPKKIWPQKKFYEAKTQEQEERHQRSDNTGYYLEPNVKSSPGGIRDIETVMWIAKRQFGSVNFNDLVNLNFLTPNERDVLMEGERQLWKIRYGLHLINGRDENRLLFEHQQKLATIFGYHDGDQLAVEQFMQVYYRTVMMVSATCELLLQHFNEDIIKSGERRRIIPINDRFQIRNNYIEVTRGNVFEEYPPALMEIFLLIGTDTSIVGTRAETIRLIQHHLPLINEDFRNNPDVIQTFLAILTTSEKLSSKLQRMERCGILGAYLPEFSRIIGQMQFDLFHIYTVDAHTLQVVRNMRRFRYKNQEQRFPVAAHIYSRLPKIELLFIAGLYHDIAKGMGGDHSELGTVIASKFCQRHKLGTWDTNLVCWLVENHLVMSSTAQRKDILDPAVIHEFALLVQDQVRLDYLYALTVADITATNPTLWNSWRASLMRQLYVATKRALRHGLENYVDRSVYITETQNHAIERLSTHGLNRDQILEIWRGVDDEYFVRESVSDIVWHTEAIQKHDLNTGPLILIRDTMSRREDEGATEIFIYTLGVDRLFATAVTAISQLGLDVVDAKIASSDSGLIFDTFVVLESNGKPVGPLKNRQEQIKSLLIEHLGTEAQIKPKTLRRIPRALKPFQFKTEVNISHDDDKQLTILEINCPDRPGLLSIIANALVELGINLHSAKITTLGESVEDVFYIADNNGELFNNSEPLAQSLRAIVDEHIQQGSDE